VTLLRHIAPLSAIALLVVAFHGRADAAGCGDLTFAGCCLGSVSYWCDGAGLHSVDCSKNPPPQDVCGWNPEFGFYDCGGLGSDPSGKSPIDCPAFPEDVVEDVPQTLQCKVGSLVSEGCQSVPFEGCCSEEGHLLFCEQGKLLCSLDCPSFLPPADTCGWSAQAGYYDCGGDGSDPGGVFPLQCPPVEVPEDVVEETAPDVGPEPTCGDVPKEGCCTGTSLHWCEHGAERMFDCASLAGDPVFGAYVYCGGHPETGKPDCIKKSDPSAPLCGQPIAEDEDKIEIVETVEAAESAEIAEAGPDHGPEAAVPDVAQPDGPGFIIEGGPQGEPDPEPAASSGCGCRTGAAGSGPGSPWLLLAAAALLAARSRRGRRCATS